MAWLRQSFVFANDAQLAALWGVAFLLLALFAAYRERRRTARRHIDAVGWMPWLPLFIASISVGGGLLAISVPVLIAEL